MEPPGGTALVEESIAEALDFRRAMRKVDEEYGKDWWFKVWGPDKLAAEGIGTARRLDAASANDKWHGFGDLAAGLQHARPDQGTIITPGLDVSGKFAKTGIPAAIVTKYLAEHGVVVEKTGLYSFFIMFTIGITKGRWNTLVTALQQFKDDYDTQPAAVARAARVLPPRIPRYERIGLRDLCAEHPRDLPRRRHRAPDDRDVPVGHAAGDEADRRLRAAWRTARSSASRSTSSKAASRPCC